MQLAQLIYASRHDGTAVDTLDRILQKSRDNNVRDGITGALIVGDQHFMQLLEGEATTIGECFMRIMRDDRHHGIQVLCAHDVDHRLFAEWSMHRIETFRIKQKILSRYTIEGVFDPARMSQRAITDMCRTLAAGDWDALAA